MHNRGPSRIVWTCVRSAGSGQPAPQRAVGEDVGFAGVELAIGTTLRWLRALTAHTAVQHVRVDGIRLQNWCLRGRPEDTPGRRGQQFSLRFVGTCRCVLPLFRNWRGGPVAPAPVGEGIGHLQPVAVWLPIESQVSIDLLDAEHCRYKP